MFHGKFFGLFVIAINVKFTALPKIMASLMAKSLQYSANLYIHINTSLLDR